MKQANQYIILILAVFFLQSPLIAKEQSAEVKASIPARQKHTTRLKNLPSSAFLSVDIGIDGKVEIYLIDEKNQKLHNNSANSIYSSRINETANFKILIPETSTYYLIIDNTDGEVSRNIKLTVTANYEKKNTSRSQQELEKIETQLRKYFIFENIHFSTQKCGTANAFSNENKVIICQEIAPKLMAIMGSKDKARDALFFSIMHEIGHVLLKQWGYPFFDNEEVADEFATALLIMFSQAERAKTQAEFFKKLSPEKELQVKRNIDDRHPISIQRARNILKWLEDDKLVKRWQKVFVPHFQTRILKQMMLSKKAWIDQRLVKAELAVREK